MNRNFWKQATERAVKTFAQAIVAQITTNNIGVTELNWVNILNIAGTAAILSVLTSIGSASFTSDGSPDITHYKLE